MPWKGWQRYRENQRLFNYEKNARAMKSSLNDNFAMPGTKPVNPVPPVHPTQKRSLFGIETQDTNTTLTKTQKTEGEGLLFSPIAALDQKISAAPSVTQSINVTGSTAPSQTNVIAPSKISGTPTSAPSQPLLSTDEAAEAPTENANANTEVVSSKSETVQNAKTEEDVRAYCEVIDMFDQIVKKLWVRGRRRKNATPRTESQWLLTSFEKDLMTKMAARLNHLANNM